MEGVKQVGVNMKRNIDLDMMISTSNSEKALIYPDQIDVVMTPIYIEQSMSKKCSIESTMMLNNSACEGAVICPHQNNVTRKHM